MAQELALPSSGQSACARQKSMWHARFLGAKSSVALPQNYLAPVQEVA